MAESPRLTRDVLRSLLGRLPRRSDLMAEVIERVDLGGIVREKVRYQAEPGEWIPAYVFVPKTRREPGPAILCLHQHAGQFQFGKSEPAGLVGNPEQAYALTLAQRGYVTLVADFIGFEERRDPAFEGNNHERFEFTRRLAEGSTLQAKMFFDTMRALDYLIARPEVDPTRVGCIGHSLGGQQTLFTAALDERIAVAVSSCGFASYRTIFRNRINHNFSLYLPDLLSHGDVGDILALVAPRPFQAVVGNADRIFPFDGIEESIAVAARRYHELGVADRLELVAVDGGHGFTEYLQERACVWLDRWLGMG
ncbi:MAG: alpha/beta hydrolase family protein [Chloroflexota bacterium]